MQVQSVLNHSLEPFDGDFLLLDYRLYTDQHMLRMTDFEGEIQRRTKNSAQRLLQLDDMYAFPFMNCVRSPKTTLI